MTEATGQPDAAVASPRHHRRGWRQRTAPRALGLALHRLIRKRSPLTRCGSTELAAPRCTETREILSDHSYPPPAPENHYVTGAPSREGPRVLRSGPGERLVLQKAQAVQGSRGGGCPGAHPTAGTHIPVLTIYPSRSCPLVLTPGIPPGGSNEWMGVMGRYSLLGRGQQGSEDPVVPPRKPKHLQHPRITLCSQPALPGGSLPETPCHPSVP